MGSRIVITGRVADPSLTVGPCGPRVRLAMGRARQGRRARRSPGTPIECGGVGHAEWISGRTGLSCPTWARSASRSSSVDSDGNCVVTKPHRHRRPGRRTDREGSNSSTRSEIQTPISAPTPPSHSWDSASKTSEPTESESPRPGPVRPSDLQGHERHLSRRISGARDVDDLRSRRRAQGPGAAGRSCSSVWKERGIRFPRSDRRMHRDRRCRPRRADSDESGLDLMEVVLRIAVADESRAAVEKFSKELMFLITRRGRRGRPVMPRGGPRFIRSSGTGPA